MNRIKSIATICTLAVVATLLAWYTYAWALADVYNASVSVFETDEEVVYYGTVTYTTSDSTNDIFTKCMYMGLRDRSQPIMIEVWGNAASGIDVNMFVYGSIAPPTTSGALDSLDRSDFLVGTTNSADLDALGAATVLIDTLEVVTGTNDDHIDNSSWIYLEFDGQAGNPAGAVINWRISVQKKEKGTASFTRSGNNVLVRPNN